MIINNHHKTIKLLFSLLALSLLVTCEKYDRDNPWDENANLNPDDWALENLDIEYVSISERTLSWNYSGDERFDGFKIDRKAGEEEWDTGYGVAEKDATSWSDNEILPDTTLTYQYRIYAYAGNNNFTSSSVSFVPDFPAPSNLKVEKQPDSDIAYKLSWTSNSTGEQGFKIDRKTTGGDWIIAFDSVPGNHTEYVDTNVFLGKSTIDVHYRVYAYYMEYETEKISTETQAALPAPSNLEITVNSIKSVSLSWQGNSIGEEGFRVERKTVDGQWTEVATVKGNTFDDDEFELNTEIYYRVSAYIGEYSSDYAENSFDSSIPPPSNFQITNNNITSVTLSWQNNSAGAEGFIIQRMHRTDMKAQYAVAARSSLIAPSSPELLTSRTESRHKKQDWETLVITTETTYIDDDFILNAQVYYRIAAYYGEHWSAFAANEFDSWIPAPSDAHIEQLSELSYKLSWQDNSNGEQGFKIDRRIDNQPWQMEYAQVEANKTSFTDPDVFTSKSAINLQYRVYAYYEAYDSEKATASIQASLSAPSNLEITRNNITSITLNWQDNSNGELGFIIQRKHDAEKRAHNAISERSNQNVVLEANTGLRRTERQKIDDGWETLTTTTETTWIDETFYLDKQVNYRVASFYENHLSEFAVNNFSSSITSPNNVQLEQLSDISYRISWDYDMQGIDGFRIDRKTGDNPWQIAYAELGKDETEFTDTNVFAGKRNTLNVEYRVYAFFEAYESGKVSVSADAQLTPPSELEISVNSITSISLSWQDNSTGEEGFKVDRKLGDDDWETGYATVSSNETSYTDDDVDLDGNHYLYRVYAFYGEYASAYAEVEYVPLMVTTNEVIDITSRSAISGGNVIADGGLEVIERGVAYSSSPNPIISDNTVPSGSGVGDFTSLMDSLTPNTTYFVRAYVNNFLGAFYGEELMFTTLGEDGLPCPGISTIQDIDGNVYNTVQIGEQCWMKENLNTTKDAEGNTIVRYCYNNSTFWCDRYGGLYRWNTMMNGEFSSNNNPSGVQGICPDGWHVPSKAEWTQLLYYLYNEYEIPNTNTTDGAGNALKSCRQLDSPLGGDCDTSEHPRWDSHNTHYGNDLMGFSALPGGIRNSSNMDVALGKSGYFWSSTEYSSSAAWFHGASNSNGSFFSFDYPKNVYLSIRCVRALQTDPSYHHLELQVNPANTGSVSGAGEYHEGAEVNITATANPGWSFVEWTGDIGYVADPTSANTIVTMPAQNISLTANFQDVGSDIVYGDGVTDIDGNEYVTVIIGNQEWMAENLRVTKYNNGDAIPTGLSNEDWGSTTNGAYAVYPHDSIPGLNSDEEVLEAYGALYNWYAASAANLLCPLGWYVPSDADWTALVDYVVSEGFPNESGNPNGAGNALKSCRQVGSPLEGCNTSEHPRWNSHSTHYGFDEFGFSAIPNGARGYSGDFSSCPGGSGRWWSSTAGAVPFAWYRSMYNSDGKVNRHGSPYRRNGFSVRCVREL